MVDQFCQSWASEVDGSLVGFERVGDEPWKAGRLVAIWVLLCVCVCMCVIIELEVKSGNNKTCLTQLYVILSPELRNSRQCTNTLKDKNGMFSCYIVCNY